MKLSMMSGAGNTFAVIDAEREVLPEDPAAFARRLSARDDWPVALPRVEGVLLVARSTNGADCRMTIFNPDGSRPAACGNGLRCVSRFARENGFAPRDRMRVETDAGVREVELVREGGVIVGARAKMGVPHKIERDIVLVTSRGNVSATLVDVGNPHCVLFVDDERVAPVHQLGRELEIHPHFPNRTNVEFATLRNERLFLRVWERGVGETEACGTGACATAIAAQLQRLVTLPVDVELPGGRLTVDWDGVGEVQLTGPCIELWRGEFDTQSVALR
jgi:diaminopimelate epimerase